MKKKGFTLIELLSVIVIVAVLLLIVIPQVTKYITKARKDSFVATANDYVSAVRNDATSEMYELPIATNDITIVSFNLIKVENNRKSSPFNARWVDNNSYVAIINIGTDIDPEYEYYVASADTKRYTIPLTNSDSINRNSIIRNNSDSTKAGITSMCGSEDGKYMILDNILGLEKYQTEYGWNATIYSADGC